MTKLDNHETKTAFATRVGLTKGRISQLIAEGLPVRADGQIDVAVGLAWIEDNLDPARRNKGGPTGQTRAATTLAEAKRLHDIVKVQRAKLAFEREQGQLVETAAATRTVFARARAERDPHIRRLGHQTTARDFRSVNKVMLGEAPLLEKLNEHGEIKAGTMAEARETYKVETWARKIGITRQVLVNDDLGAFSDLARRMGQAAAETEARFLVTLLEAGNGNGPTLSDSKTLFHADHGNKAGTGAVISDATLSAARLALRTQKGIEDRTIRVTPDNLLVPPALETTAEKWLASIAPATAADVNPFSGSLSLAV